MWQQWATYGLQLPHTESVENGFYDPFHHFAKRSREVHRQNEAPPAMLARSPLCQYDDYFWDRILQRPGEEELGYDVLCSPSTDLVSGCKGERRAGFHLEKLPSPVELMGRRKKKRGGTQKGNMSQRQAAVTQHIGDLKRKQSFIDQMKGDKLWGSTTVSRPEKCCLPEEGTEAGFAIPTPDLGLRPSPSLHVLHSTPQRHTSLFSQEQSIGGCKDLLDLAPGGNPMMSFVFMGTASRGAEREWDSPILPHSEFLGIGCNIEE